MRPNNPREPLGEKICTVMKKLQTQWCTSNFNHHPHWFWWLIQCLWASLMPQHPLFLLHRCAARIKQLCGYSALQFPAIRSNPCLYHFQRPLIFGASSAIQTFFHSMLSLSNLTWVYPHFLSQFPHDANSLFFASHKKRMVFFGLASLYVCVAASLYVCIAPQELNPRRCDQR